tara:strand:+ start:729 stop:1040 length:312 start_codon:yes stop_codon:yes gene_type:complete
MGRKRRTSSHFPTMIQAVQNVANKYDEVSTNLIMDEVVDEYYRLMKEVSPFGAYKHANKYRDNVLAMSQFIAKGLRKQGGWTSKVDTKSNQLLWRKTNEDMQE